MNTTTSLPLASRADAPTEPVRTPPLPVSDPLRQMPDGLEMIEVDCRLWPDEYLREAVVTGGGE